MQTRDIQAHAVFLPLSGEEAHSRALRTTYQHHGRLLLSSTRALCFCFAFSLSLLSLFLLFSFYAVFFCFFLALSLSLYSSSSSSCSSSAGLGERPRDPSHESAPDQDSFYPCLLISPLSRAELSQTLKPPLVARN